MKRREADSTDNTINNLMAKGLYKPASKKETRVRVFSVQSPDKCNLNQCSAKIKVVTTDSHIRIVNLKKEFFSPKLLGGFCFIVIIERFSDSFIVELILRLTLPSDLTELPFVLLSVPLLILKKTDASSDVLESSH